MRILLSFQLWLLPLLDEEKKGSSDRRWGLESFYHLRITDFPCMGRKTWTTVPVKQWRLRWNSKQCACAFLFRYFNFAMPRKKNFIVHEPVRFETRWFLWTESGGVQASLKGLIGYYVCPAYTDTGWKNALIYFIK